MAPRKISSHGFRWSWWNSSDGWQSRIVYFRPITMNFLVLINNHPGADGAPEQDDIGEKLFIGRSRASISELCRQVFVASLYRSRFANLKQIDWALAAREVCRRHMAAEDALISRKDFPCFKIVKGARPFRKNSLEDFAHAWARFHQFGAVRKLLHNTPEKGSKNLGIVVPGACEALLKFRLVYGSIRAAMGAAQRRDDLFVIG